MKNIVNMSSLLLALVLGFSSMSAQAVITAGMNAAQVQAEITAMLAPGVTDPATGQPYTLMSLAQSAQAVGISADTFTTAAISASVISTTVVYTAITVWGQAAAPLVVSAAVAAVPANAGAIVAMALQVAPSIPQATIQGVAIAAGGDPAVVNAATAAGGAAAGAAAGAAGGAGTGLTVAPLICSGVSKC